MEDMLQTILEKITNMESTMDSRMNVMQKDISVIQKDIKTIQSDNVVMRNNMNVMQKDIKTIQSNNIVMQEDIKEIKVNAEDTNNMINHIFNDIYRLGKQIEHR